MAEKKKLKVKAKYIIHTLDPAIKISSWRTIHGKILYNIFCPDCNRLFRWPLAMSQKAMDSEGEIEYNCAGCRADINVVPLNFLALLRSGGIDQYAPLFPSMDGI